MYARVIQKPQRSCFLFGARGMGKSFWLRQTFPEAYFIDFLDSESVRLYLAKPERLVSVVEGILKTTATQTIIINEVQKVPQILDSIHLLMNRYPDLTFILTGSSARKLKREHNLNLLGGRASFKTMHPFMAFELGDDFVFEKSIQ